MNKGMNALNEFLYPVLTSSLPDARINSVAQRNRRPRSTWARPTAIWRSMTKSIARLNLKSPPSKGNIAA